MDVDIYYYVLYFFHKKRMKNENSYPYKNNVMYLYAIDNLVLFFDARLF